MKRFWEKVDTSGGTEACWPWTATTRAGYGQIKLNGRMHYAHRVAFWLTHERWPEPCCLHTCDNPLCINPAHLWEGTHHDNMRDKARKGRTPDHAGEKNPRARLTERDAEVIRLLCGRIGLTQREVARRYGVSQSAVWAAVNEKTWRTS
jgi:DNA-binding CsgD family transcriptional regulator